MKLKPVDATRHAFSLVDEFKEFAFRGNVVDLAIGVIIGGAFGSIVRSLVDNNIITPLISLFLPANHRLEERTFDFFGHSVHYGQFLADFLHFLIVAAALFLFVVKFLGWIMRVKKQEAEAPPAPSHEEALLSEIRDLLKAQGPASTSHPPLREHIPGTVTGLRMLSPLPAGSQATGIACHRS